LDKLDSNYRHQIYHAMYNGGLIVNYASKESPIYQRTIDEDDRIVEILEGDDVLMKAGGIVTSKSYMIRIRLNNNADTLVNHVKSLLYNKAVSVSSSGWAIDVGPRGIDKGFALKTLQDLVPKLADKKLAKLGDKGGINGNDYSLLRNECSFSVDEISSSINSCFPIIHKDGEILKGVSATEYFLQNLNI